jgi:thiol-disulfide isomerase/thioredoxin
MSRILRFALCLTLSAAPAGAADGLGVGRDAAETRLAAHALKRLDGSGYRLADLRGEVVVVNFWATWCAPCRRELPALASLHEQLKSRGGRVVAVSIDVEPDRVRRYLRAERLSLDVAHDGPDGLARELDLRAVPLTVVLDRDGRIAFTSRGTDRAALAALHDRARVLSGGGAPVTTTEEDR